MAKILGPKKVQRYSVEFKLKAVKLSQLKGVQVQDVAEFIIVLCRSPKGQPACR